MKHALLYLLSCLPIFCIVCTPEKATATHPSRAVIHGTVPEKNQMIYWMKDPVNRTDDGEKPADSAMIDANGTFNLRVEASANSFYYLRIGSRHIGIPFYCKGGDSIMIRQKSTDTTPEVLSDNGGATRFSKFFFTKFQLGANFFDKIQTGDWKECFKILDEQTQSQSTFLMMNTYLLNNYPALKREMEDVVRYSGSSHKLNLLMYLYYDDNDSVRINDTHCADFMDRVKLKHDTMPMTMSYTNFLSTYLEFPFKQWKKANVVTTSLARKDRFSLKFEYCKSHLTGRSRDYGMYYCVVNLFNFFSDSTALEVVKKQLQDYRKDVTDIRYYNMANTLYQTKLAMSEGKAAPNFTLPDLTSKNISLSDFKGKTVYMEFTGTWCGPCRKEIPYIKELQKKCKNNPNIQFLTVWLEGETPEMWVRYVQSTGVDGAHVYSKDQFAGAVPKLYMISGVPAFMIIDKNGNVAMPSAKHPSEDGVYEELMRVAGR